MTKGASIPVHAEHDHGHEEENPKEYGKLALVIGLIFLTALIIFLAIDGSGPFNELSDGQAFISQFMGVFFIVFAVFKLVNIESFVHGFRMYDVIAAKSQVYARLYPVIQLLLGAAMFVFPQYALTHAAALVISGLALVGVVNSLRNKREIQCACLGNVIKMPLATVSAIEDGTMFVLAAYMFIAMMG